MQRAPAQGRRAGLSADGPMVTAGAYLALFILGVVEGLLGTFHYSNGPAPLAAVCFAVAILVTCVLGAWGMRSGAGGVLPAAGWYLTTTLLSSGKDGSVLITNTAAGKWFLFGGALLAAAGMVIGIALFRRPGHAPRLSGPGTRPGRSPSPGRPRR